MLRAASRSSRIQRSPSSQLEMTMGDELRYSRPQKTAEALGELAEDRHRFLEKKVLLTGEEACLVTSNGEGCLLDALRLLVRISRNLTVRLPPGFIELNQKA